MAHSNSVLNNVGTTIRSKKRVILRLLDLSIREYYFPGIIMVGKMHSAGVDEPIGDVKSITEFIEAGADVVLVPAVGTVPGFTEADLTSIVQLAHLHDTLVCSAIGTSQEGSSTSVIENMAIRNKICGVDIQHIGDSGFSGVAPVENIYTMS